MKSQGTRNYNSEAADHAEHSYAFEFDYVMHGFMLRSFAPYLAPGNALELGCYHGNFTQLLCDRFRDVDVVDASSKCIEQASARVGARARFHLSRFEEFNSDDTFANIFLIHTLEHLDRRVEALEKIGSWLSKKGRFFIAAPNAHAGSRQIAVAMGLIPSPTAVTEAESAHGHRVTYTLDALEADAVAASLRIVKRGGVFFKGLANFQIDRALDAGIISPEYLEGCYLFGDQYPDLCSSIYLVCERG